MKKIKQKRGRDWPIYKKIKVDLKLALPELGKDERKRTPNPTYFCHDTFLPKGTIQNTTTSVLK